MMENNSSKEFLYNEMSVDPMDNVQIMVIVCEAILALVIVTGNLFVLALFYQERKAHHISHKYIISMAVSDLMQGLYNAPSVIYLTFGVKVASDQCLYSLLFGSIFALSSLVGIVATTIDRYWAIVHPFSYQANATPKVANVIIISSWVIGSIPAMLAIPLKYESPYPDLPCFVLTERTNKYLGLGVFVFIVVPSVLVVFFMYIRIYRVILDVIGSSSNTIGSKLTRLQGIVLSTNNGDETPQKRSSCFVSMDVREIRTTLIIFATVILYALSWMPGVVLITYLVHDPQGVGVGWMVVAFTLPHLHSAFNPFLYAFNIKGARDSARHLLKRIFCLESGPPPRPISFISNHDSKSSRTSSSSFSP